MYAANIIYAATCYSDGYVVERGGNPREAWMGCAHTAQFYAHVIALVEGFSKSQERAPSKRSRLMKRSRKR